MQTITLNDEVYQMGLQLSQKRHQPLDAIIANMVRETYEHERCQSQVSSSPLTMLTGIEPLTMGRHTVSDADVQAIRDIEQI